MVILVTSTELSYAVITTILVQPVVHSAFSNLGCLSADSPTMTARAIFTSLSNNANSNRVKQPRHAFHHINHTRETLVTKYRSTIMRLPTTVVAVHQILQLLVADTVATVLVVDMVAVVHGVAMEAAVHGADMVATVLVADMVAVVHGVAMEAAVHGAVMAAAVLGAVMAAAVLGVDSAAAAMAVLFT